MEGGRFLVTGASGFVGGAVLARLLRDGLAASATIHRGTLPPHLASVPVTSIELAPGADWSTALRGASTVIHCAARVHVMRETDPDPLAAFRRANVSGTLTLARQAHAAGVRRFVFLSSIAVNGAATHERPFRADDPPAPHSPYGVSKHEAEIALREFGAASGLEVVILRPPMVYGPLAPGHFERLLRSVRRGVPLPLGSIDNRRSFVALENLVDLIVTAALHRDAAGRTLLVSDGEDLSTPELVRRLAHALGRPARLLPVPPALIFATARLLGRSDIAQRLCASLQLDIEPTRRALAWTPPVSVDAGLAAALAATGGARA